MADNLMDRENKKKQMTSAGIVASGMGIALLLGAFNVVDIEFLSVVIVGLTTWLANTIYVIFKGPKQPTE